MKCYVRIRITHYQHGVMQGFTTHSSLEILGLHLCVTNIAIHCKTLHNPTLAVLFLKLLESVKDLLQVKEIECSLPFLWLCGYRFLLFSIIRLESVIKIEIRVRNLKFATYLKFTTCENTNKINELW